MLVRSSMRRLASLGCIVILALVRLNAANWPEASSARFVLDTSIPYVDADQDRMADAWEAAHGLNPAVNDAAFDPDGDGRSNLAEYNAGTDPQVPDGIPGFGFSGRFTLVLRSLIADSDNDGMPDAWEGAHGLNPGVNDATLDPDGDGLTNLQEYNGGWDPQARELASFMVSRSDAFVLDSGGPRYALLLDTDGDGMPDWWEIQYGLNLFVNDAAGDLDGDGWSNVYEYQHGAIPTVNDVSGLAWALSLRFLFDTVGRPADSDADGMPDFWETAHGLNPTLDDANGDADGDGRANRAEYNAGTDPQVDDWHGPWIVASARFILDTGGFAGGYALDSDVDGMPDWWEIIHGLNPAANDSAGNADGDLLTNLQEYNAGTNPQSNDWLGNSAAVSARFTLRTIVDLDGDGIHDSWEVYYFGSKEACDPMADNDGDRMRNDQEFLAGTDPLNPSSLLVLAGAEQTLPAGMTIKWTSVSNKTYLIERSADLTSGFPPPLATAIEATPPLNSFTDATATNAGPYFYRIRISVP